MKHLIMTAAVALLAGGAHAQSECALKCSKEKAAAAITQVADEAKTCSAEKAAQCAEKAQACGEKSGAAITQVSAKADGCCPEKAAAQVTQVASEAKACSAEQIAECAAAGKSCADKCDDGAAITLASTSGDECASKSACSDDQRVSFESWKKTIPVMGYSVGDKTTTCSKTAASMCDKSGDKMAYVVNGQTFENESDAMAAHTAALNAKLDSMTRVSFVVGGENVECPMTAGQMCEKTGQAMQYRVGPAVFDSAEEAVKAAAMAYGMSRSVNVSYEVDGKATTCSKTASTMCTEGKAMTYVVGETKTRCNVQADHVLASERVSKALEALAMATRQS